MSTEVPELREFHRLDLEDAPALGEEPMYAVEGRLFFGHDGRNAWHSTWVERYAGPRAFAPRPDTLVTRIERTRVQGSVWYIHSLPSLVFMGRESALIVSEINTFDTLAAFGSIRSWGRTLRDIGRQFQPPNEDSVVRFVTPSCPQLISEDKPIVTRSRPNGASYLLSWRRHEAFEYEVAHVQSLVESFRDGRADTSEAWR